MKSWNWIAPYIVAMLLATGLAVALGNAPLFKSTSLGDTGLTAARVVQFIGLGAGLWLFWALGLRVAAHIPEVPILLSTIRRLMTPLVTLVVLSSAYNVILLVADPFMDRSSRQFYDWTFIIAIILAAAWITLAGFWISETQVTGEEAALEDETQPSDPESCRCPQCASVIVTGMRFCGSCGCPIG